MYFDAGIYFGRQAGGCGRAYSFFQRKYHLSDRRNHRYIGTVEKEGIRPDLVHIGNTPYYREAVEALLPLADTGTCFIIGTPYADASKKSWWKELVADERTGVTFDLYDVGLVFFDKRRAKEHRIINFL